MTILYAGYEIFFTGLILHILKCARKVNPSNDHVIIMCYTGTNFNMNMKTENTSQYIKY